MTNHPDTRPCEGVKKSIATMPTTNETAASVLSLIESIEKATAPDRELDYAIAKAIGFVTLKGQESWTTPHYTSSIDAAMTLVPDFINRRWYLADSDVNSGGSAVASVYHPADMAKGGIPRSVGMTPAIALCIAALKALNSVRGAS